ncbi:MAG: FAD-binding oxidoreductase, partial [Pseudomonadota bacterium]
PTWYQHECGPASDYAPIQTDEHTQVLIIGAGLAGLSTAASLVDRGFREIVILEQGQPGEGASGRNGGFVFGGYSRSPASLRKQLGQARAVHLQSLTHRAVERVRSRCHDLGVPIEPHGVLLVDWFKNDKRLQRDAQRHQHNTGQEWTFLNQQRLQSEIRSQRYGSALLEADAFHFNPLQYVRALSDWLVQHGVRIHGHSRVDRMVRDSSGPSAVWSVRSNGVRIRAEQVVLACGGYAQGAFPKAQRAIQPIGTYISVTEPLGERLIEYLPTRAAVYDNRFAFDYYRRVGGDRLLWGGRISIADRRPNQIEALMRKDLRKVFPALADASFDFSWGGWMSYARHEMPILGSPEPGLWSAYAFGGHGMAPTNVAGEVIAASIAGDASLMNEFSAWRAEWAGGGFGRLWAQGLYWAKQGADGLRALRSS